MLQAIHDAVASRGTPEADALAHHVLSLINRLSAAPEAAEDIEARLASAEAELRDAQRRLQDVAERRAHADARLQHAERQARLWRQPAASKEGSVHGRVHLLPSAPDWLLIAARRAFRTRYHPDRYADQTVRANAEILFKTVESVFADLRTPRLSNTGR